MRLFGQMIGETLRALAVLALVLLSYGHQPLVVPSAFATGDTLSVAAASFSYCGGPVSDDERGHAPCHACRIGAGALPPPEGGLLHLPRPAAIVETCPLRVAVATIIPGLAQARAPPALA